MDDRQTWLDALLQPIAIAGTTLPNRVMMSALTLQYGVDGLVSDRHLAFYRERARGEVGLLFSEQLDASPLCESPFTHALRAYDSRQVAAFQRIAATLRPFETRFFVQLFSAGAAGQVARDGMEEGLRARDGLFHPEFQNSQERLVDDVLGQRLVPYQGERIGVEAAMVAIVEERGGLRLSRPKTEQKVLVRTIRRRSFRHDFEPGHQ